MFAPGQVSDIQKIVKDILAHGIVDKKVCDTPQEYYDTVNKGYADSVSVPKFGTGYHTLNGATGTTTIAHGLGRTPLYLRLTGFAINGTVFYGTVGVYDGTNQYHVSSYGGGATNDGIGTIIQFTDGGSNTTVAAVSWDATNFYLAWNAVGTIFGTVHYLWEIQ